VGARDFEQTFRAVLNEKGVLADCEFFADSGTVHPPFALLFIAHTDDARYFISVANRENRPLGHRVLPRGPAMRPSCGTLVARRATVRAAYEKKRARASRLTFAPCGSCFVVFGEPVDTHRPTSNQRFCVLILIQDVSSCWGCIFDPKWGDAPNCVSIRCELARPREPALSFILHSTYEITSIYGGAVEGETVFLDLGDSRTCGCEVTENRAGGVGARRIGWTSRAAVRRARTR